MIKFELFTKDIVFLAYLIETAEKGDYRYCLLTDNISITCSSEIIRSFNKGEQSRVNLKSKVSKGCN